MKRRTVLAFGALLIATAALGAESAAPGASKKRYVITGVEPAAIRQAVARTSLAGDIQFAHDLRYHKGVVFFAAPETVQALQAQVLVQGLSAAGQSPRIEEDYVVYLADAIPGAMAPAAEPGPGEQKTPWGVSMVRASEAFRKARGKGVTVCVLDTGVRPDHPDLSDNIVGGENFTSSRASAWADDNGHGTHVAGTIAALDNGIGVVGVAPEAKIFVAKVMNAGGTGNMSDVADGIRSCVEHGAQVLNMSLATPSRPEMLQAALKDAAREGVISVAASGNWSRDVAYPAKFPEVVAVTGVDSNRNFLTISNTGPEVQFTAPGKDVISTLMKGGYGPMTGTSMAAPHVAGVAALMISANKLTMQGDDIGLSANRQGKGLVNALKTVEGVR